MSDDLIAAARDALDASLRVVVLTGAGISTDSGIPDFRGPNGLWTKNPAAEKASNIEYYLNDPEVRRAAWQNRLTTPAWTAEPNPGHAAIVELERQGRLHGLVTQNIDGLHQKAGNDPDKVIEVHGTVWWTRCWECSDRRPMAEALDRVRAGEDDPPCLVCGGVLKSDTISFGQALVPEVIDRALQVSEKCDLHAGGRVDPQRLPGCQLRAQGEGRRRAGDHRQRGRDGDGSLRRLVARRPDRRGASDARCRRGRRRELMRPQRTRWLVGAVMLVGAACSEGSDAVCLTSGSGDVCADGSDGSIEFSGSGLEPGSEVRLESDELGPVVLRVDADGGLDPTGAAGVLALFSGTEFTFAVSAVDVEGNPIVGDITVST